MISVWFQKVHLITTIHCEEVKSMCFLIIKCNCCPQRCAAVEMASSACCVFLLHQQGKTSLWCGRLEAERCQQQMFFGSPTLSVVGSDVLAISKMPPSYSLTPCPQKDRG